MRRLFDITESQMKKLSLFCKENKISQAEAIRRAVDSYIPDKPKKTIAEHPAVGLWTDKQDSLEYIKKLRAEWN